MVLTNTFLSEIRTSVKADLVTYMDYIAVGDGDNTPTAGDTVLESETFRNAADEVDSSSQVLEVTSSLLIDTSENNGETIQEVGVFASSSGGTMVHRNLLTNEITKTSDINVRIDSTIVVVVSEG